MALQENDEAGGVSTSFQAFSDQFELALAWVDSLGLRFEKSRFGNYRRIVRDAAKILDDPDESKSRLGFAALESGYELILIHENLTAYCDDDFKERLQKFLNGAILEKDESEASGHARDIGLELVLGAHMAKSDIEPSFPPGYDISLSSPAANIECKRLHHSEQAVEKAVSIASKQLKRRHSPPGPRSPGIIALSIGKLYHHGEKYLVSKSGEKANATMGRICIEFADANRRHWNDRPKRHVQAVLCYMSGIAHAPDNNQWYWSYFMLFDLIGNYMTPTMQQSLDSLESKLRVGIGETLL